jgi:uncharacterized membrane protein YedE/YeeE
VGEGKVLALVVVAGIVVGTYLYGWIRSALDAASGPRPATVSAGPLRGA